MSEHFLELLVSAGYATLITLAIVLAIVGCAIFFDKTFDESLKNDDKDKRRNND